MEFKVLDTLSIYRKIVEAKSVEKKTEIYREELMRPFEKVLNTFGGSVDPAKTGMMDGMNLFGMWSYLPPERIDGSVSGLLDDLEKRDVWETSEKSLALSVKAFEPYADKIPLDKVILGIFLSDPARLMPRDRGFAGFGAIPGYTMLSFSEPNEYSIERLPGSVAHEFHHGIRTTLFKWNPMELTVADYIVIEGLAESFATELFGDEMLYYVMKEFDQAKVPEVKKIIGDALWLKGFNEVRRYIFGDEISQSMHGTKKLGLPLLAGYTMGYHVVQEYLKNTGKNVMEATFKKGEEIVKVAKFFK